MGDFSTANIPFPPVVLTEDEIESLRATSEEFVKDHIREYAQLRMDQRGRLDSAQWKVVLQKENVTVYKERSKFRGSSMPKTTIHRTQQQRVQNLDAAQSTMPVMLSVGTIPGSLEDVMFGLVLTTTTSIKVKTAYWQDHLIDGGVLATIVRPTEDDPFHTANIKWIVKGIPAYVRSIVHARDLVYSEYTGIVECDNGERIGYRAQRSVEIPGVRDLYEERGLVRMQYSTCSLFRELADGSIECFVKGVMDPRGSVIEKVAVDTAAEALVAYWRCTYTSQMKKLAYFVRHSKPLTQAQQRTKTSKCGGCLKSFNLLMRVKSCRLCGVNICSKCTVQRKLCFVLPNERMVQRKLSFCLTCLGKVNCSDTRQIAIQELVHGDQFLLSPPSRDIESSQSGVLHQSPTASSIVIMTAPITSTPYSDFEPSSSLLNSQHPDSTARASFASKTSNETTRSNILLDDAAYFRIPSSTRKTGKTAPADPSCSRSIDESDQDQDGDHQDQRQIEDDEGMQLAPYTRRAIQSQQINELSSQSQCESCRLTFTSSVHSSLSYDDNPLGITPPTKIIINAQPTRCHPCSSQQQLYKQMVGLCQAAENVHQLAMHNTTLMNQQNHVESEN